MRRTCPGPRRHPARFAPGGTIAPAPYLGIPPCLALRLRGVRPTREGDEGSGVGWLQADDIVSQTPVAVLWAYQPTNRSGWRAAAAFHPLRLAAAQPHL